MASLKASQVEIDPQVAVKPSNQAGQPLPNGLTDLKKGVQKRPRKRFRPRKIDRRSAHEKWLFKMAKRPLHDLLPRNSAIHNFTSLKLTDRQARVLGMG